MVAILYKFIGFCPCEVVKLLLLRASIVRSQKELLAKDERFINRSPSLPGYVSEHRRGV